jgi:SAM-dependent methyltransferase
MDHQSLIAHAAYGQIEESFNEALDATLRPRGPDWLYDLVARLQLPSGAVVLDAGCGAGRHTIELARRFGLSVRGIEPASLELNGAMAALAEAAVAEPRLRDLVTFEMGSVTDLPAADRSVDLVWCRDVLCLVEDLRGAYAEIRRVLKPGGRALIYQAFATDRLEPREAAWLLPTMGCVARNMRPAFTEDAIHEAGLMVERCYVLESEWGEFGQEQTGKPARKLLHAARLLRDPQRYIEQFGPENYDIALGDALWHVYRMIGKLSDRVYVLSRPER